MRTVAIAVSDTSQTGEARREAALLAAKAGFNETDTGRVSLVATEAATNLLRHGGGGFLLASVRVECGTPVIEILALDKGPGIRDLEQSLRDGYSTAGGAGTGLGAMKRLSTDLDVYSAPGKGAAILARIRPDGRKPTLAAIEFGGVCVPVRGEHVCGDAWAVQSGRHGATVLVADGLGHGPQAAEAAAEAVNTFERNAGLPEVDLMDYIHGALRSTRGAAVAIVNLVLEKREVRFTGVGNIAGAVIGDGLGRQMISHAGTVGHALRKVHCFTYAWPKGALVLIYSDGISSHISLEAYPGLLSHDPSLIAGVVFRDFNRGRDDATVVAARG